jgi:hypothetical protein
LCSCQALLRGSGRGGVGEVLVLVVVVVATRRPQRQGRLHGVAASRCRASWALAGDGGRSLGRGMVECPLSEGVGARSNTWASCMRVWWQTGITGPVAHSVARSTRRQAGKQASRQGQSSRDYCAVYSAHTQGAQME